MARIELIYYISGSILYILLIGGFLWFVISLFRVWNYERKINKLYSELEVQIEEEKNRLVSMPIIEGRIKKLKEDYKPRIKGLERKRQFILEKLPFIK